MKGDLRLKTSVSRKVLGAIAVLLASFALSFVLTFLLFPLWSWVESAHGIESVGHSGPADWCFLVTFGVVLVVLAAVVGLSRRRTSRATG